MSPALEIRVLRSDEIERAQRLRYEVWRAEGAVLANAESGKIEDAHDYHALHWGAFDGEELVGSARLCVHESIDDAPDASMFAGVNLPEPVASMNRLVILRPFRGNGIGRSLDEVRLEAARLLGARSTLATPVDVSAREQSLARLGFTRLQNVRGNPCWSQSVSILAYYMVLSSGERDR